MPRVRHTPHKFEFERVPGDTLIVDGHPVRGAKGEYVKRPDTPAEPAKPHNNLVSQHSGALAYDLFLDRFISGITAGAVK